MSTQVIAQPTPDLMVEVLVREIDEERGDVLDAYDADERAILDLVPIRVYWSNSHDSLSTNNHENTWASAMYRPDSGSVEFYGLPLFSQWAGDPVVRRSEIRRILAHEYEHALGRNFDEYAPREAALTPAGWHGRRSITVQHRGMSITLPTMGG